MSHWLELNNVITYNCHESREIKYLAMGSMSIMIGLD